MRNDIVKIYTDTEATKNLPILLNEAQKAGAVGIRCEDGRTFVVAPERAAASPLDVPGVDLGVTTEEIVACVREGRRTES